MPDRHRGTRLKIDLSVAAVVLSLSLGAFSAIYALYVNSGTIKALKEIQQASNSLKEDYARYLSRIVESTLSLLQPPPRSNSWNF